MSWHRAGWYIARRLLADISQPSSHVPLQSNAALVTGGQRHFESSIHKDVLASMMQAPSLHFTRGREGFRSFTRKNVLASVLQAPSAIDSTTLEPARESTCLCDSQGQGGRGAAHGDGRSQTNRAAQLPKELQACPEGIGPDSGERRSSALSKHAHVLLSAKVHELGLPLPCLLNKLWLFGHALRTPA